MAGFVEKTEKAVVILIVLSVFMLTWIFIQVQLYQGHSTFARAQREPHASYYRTKNPKGLTTNYSRNSSDLHVSITNRIGNDDSQPNVCMNCSGVSHRPKFKSPQLTLELANSTDAKGRAGNRNSSGEGVPAKSGLLDLCREDRTNFFFLKTHKTGSTTLAHILNQFGYRNGISFLLNKNNYPTGNINFVNDLTGEKLRSMIYPPVGVKSGDWGRYQYQASTVHMVYNRDITNQFFVQSKTRYITILRNPVDQFISSFHYFKNAANFLWKNGKGKSLTMEGAINQFLDNPEIQSKTHSNGSIHGWHFFHNSQIYDLGLDHRYHNDERRVNETIEKLDTEFDLILITEYFDDSLLLLRKMMCWEWSDIVYISKNLSPGGQTPLTEKVRQRIGLWNHADTLLYRKFKSKFLRLLESYGASNLEKDRKYFKELLKGAQIECISKKRTLRRHIPHVEYFLKKNASGKCKTLAQSSIELTRTILRRQRPKRIKIVKRKAKKSKAKIRHHSLANSTS